MNDLNYGFCLEDASLDMLLRLLFDQMEAEEIDAYLSAPAPGLTDEEAASLRRAYDRAVRQHAREKKREKFARLRRAGRRLLDRVALVILILSLTVTAALAAFPEFRMTVMRLLAEVDDRQQAMTFHLQPQTAAVEVPEDWRGDYYPSYLPQGFSVTEMNPYFAEVTYEREDGAQIFFSESTEEEHPGITAGLEGAVRDQIILRGVPAHRIRGTTSCCLVWMEDDRLFELIAYHLPDEEAERIASSLVRVRIKK